MKKMKYWRRHSQKEITQRVFSALEQNINYFESDSLGVPGSHLDDKVFYQDAPFLKDAPFLSTLIHNPNHIGCHTLGSSESLFSGTQLLERELMQICTEDILNGAPDAQDGYVAAGGTEANMQAIWIYRNFFQEEHQAKSNEIAILCSSDAHYSMYKASNVFGVSLFAVPVDEDTRNITEQAVQATYTKAKAAGKKYFIVVANMMTTMFGSVDNVEAYTSVLEAQQAPYKLHLDGAYGGFIYPFSEDNPHMDFRNPKVTSITLDAHKMVQAPYGTGIFTIRKGYMQYSKTGEASYVEGQDYTLSGSRSGANAVAVWMILVKNGPFGWKEKSLVLLHRTTWLCKQLDALNIPYFREPSANIVTIKAHAISAKIAAKYGLVPDNHDAPKWYKVVVMDHVTIDRMLPLVEDLAQE